MQINIDKKTGILLSIIGALLISIVIVASAGMGNSSSEKDELGMMGGHGHNSNSQMVGSDAMFLQMMIPHHEQAVVMSDLALSISKDADVLKLAKQIKDAQAPEIIKMQGWLTDAGLSEDPGHSMGDGMGGMLSDSELSALKVSTGKAFDKLFLAGMIAHHEGAIQMVMMIENSPNSEIKNLGQAIIKSQSAEIDLMKELLNKI
ncbi:MAG: hypothetical protein RIT31_317 [Actinomycetota bacterium]